MSVTVEQAAEKTGLQQFLDYMSSDEGRESNFGELMDKAMEIETKWQSNERKGVEIELQMQEIWNNESRYVPDEVYSEKDLDWVMGKSVMLKEDFIEVFEQLKKAATLSTPVNNEGVQEDNAEALRNSFYKETGNHWSNYRKYFLWLENKIAEYKAYSLGR